VAGAHQGAHRTLTQDSVDAMRDIVAYVRAGRPPNADAAFVDELSARLRETEQRIHEAAGHIETEIQDAITAWPAIV